MRRRLRSPCRGPEWLLQQKRLSNIRPPPEAPVEPAQPQSSRAAGSTGCTGAPGEFSMSMRMLIDARHPEETRVAVAKGNRIEEFDFESAEHKQLKGNIYLAKVTRVEPSLQAAFVDYGGNRHGFLAFSEIHPDYYQIPKADREALLREEAEHAAEEERLRSAEFDNGDDHGPEPEALVEDAEFADGTATTTEAGTESSRSPVDESAADELRKKRQNLR